MVSEPVAFVFFDYFTCQPLVSMKRKQYLVSMRNEEDLGEAQEESCKWIIWYKWYFDFSLGKEK